MPVDLTNIDFYLYVLVKSSAKIMIYGFTFLAYFIIHWATL